ncbi:MAG: hypothetical protein WC812_00415 [Candidatus Pacearchaeota archaeon]|jgi:hypothetical protein
MVEERYEVVFEYTEKAGAYAGNRFRVSYRDKNNFLEMHNPKNEKLKVIAENISDEESLRLCEEVPLQNMINSAVKNSIDDEKNVNFFALTCEIRNVLESLENPKKALKTEGGLRKILTKSFESI